jgi:FtsP/CotA-like multicopper oxidase with cupredoxin domain
MSSGARIGLVLGTVVAIVLAFVLLSPGGDDDSKTAGTVPTTTAVPATTSTAPAATGGTPATAEPTPAQPTFETIRVQNGKPAGGVKTITVTKGDRVRIEVRSPDTSDEIHLHGYDLKRDPKAGGRVRFSFDANVEGIFEIELESAGTQIGKLVVEP